jgi:starvation-inducible DNA-binding protein
MIEVKERKRKRIYSKLGYSEKETNELVTLMNTLLANYNVHYQKLRNFHWNVVGADFFDIHEQFEMQYNDAKVFIDEIAERIRVFGKTPLSTMKDYLEESEIKEASTDIEAMQMVKFIIEDYRVLMERMFDVLDTAIEYGDSGTEDMIKDQIKKIEKYHWMMTSFSSKK